MDVLCWTLSSSRRANLFSRNANEVFLVPAHPHKNKVDYCDSPALNGGQSINIMSLIVVCIKI